MEIVSERRCRRLSGADRAALPELSGPCQTRFMAKVIPLLFSIALRLLGAGTGYHADPAWPHHPRNSAVRTHMC